MYKEWVEINRDHSKFNIIRYFKNWKTSYIIFKSGLFNSSYYFKQYPDVFESLNSGFFYRLSVSRNRIFQLIGKAVVHPIRHYVWKGVYEGKNPCDFFDTSFYIENNHDVALNGINPFLHYITNGKNEGRKSQPSWYDLDGNPDFIKSQAKILKQSELFDEKYYLEKNIDVKEAGIDPVEHYCKYGWKEKRNPSALFNTELYLENNKDVRDAGINPLYHYIIFGKKEGRSLSGNDRKMTYKRDKTIVFVGHEAEQTGAPIILLDIIKWFNKFTAYKVKVILLRGGQIQKEYEKSAETLTLYNITDKENTKKQIEEFIGDDDCLIFLNTVVAARFVEFMDLSKYPNVAFIHELEKTLKIFPKETKLLKKNVRSIIAASDAVTNNLITNHGYSENEVETVFAFIDPQHQFLDDIERSKRRQKLNLPTDKILIFGCGSIYWRKNPKGFIEIAEKVINKTNKECEFIWIGNGEERAICEKMIKKKNLKEYVKFIGSVDNPRDYFAAGDIFLLSAIEDPFPLVCLEAADCGLPVICFDEAGGMPRFVEDDAGFVVPFNNNDAMAEAVIKLVEDKELREKLGKTAREKVLNRHVINKSAQQIKKIIDNKLEVNPLVSVVVPNYNHSKYLPQRLDSIYNQTYKDIEVILLDDVSSDNSREILDEYAKNNPYITRRIYNKVNSGNVFLQWQKGIDAANGEFIWIAESDDYSDKNFIEKVLPPLKDEDTILSYSNSNIIGSNGQHYNTYDNVPWLTDISETKWKSNYINKGRDEFEEALAIKCTIPNVSAVIFRKKYSLEALRHSFKYKKAGDWIFYAYMSRYGNIAYCSQPLNYHRRHEGTVTSKEGDDRGVNEIFKIHEHYVNNFYVPYSVRQSMISFIQNEYNIYKNRGSVSKPLQDLYNKEYILNAPHKTKVALFQHGLNFGKGGAEKMLIEKANQLYVRGYGVSIYNRTYSDNPLPYKLNPNISVYSVGIEEDISNVLPEVKPDVCIVFSIGHPDTQNIKQFQKQGVPVILSMHNQPSFFDKSPGKKEHMESIKQADIVVTLLPSFKEEYLNRRVSTRVEVISNFVCKPKVHGKFNGLNGRKYIFNAGRLVDQKQQNILIDAFAKLASDYQNWDLIIAGEGHLRPNLEKQIEDYGLKDRVILLGQIDNIGDYYKHCEFFVLSSKFEGFSLVPIEASAFGKPIVLFKDCLPYNETFGENDKMIRVQKMSAECLEKTLRACIEQKIETGLSEKMIKFYKEYSPQTIIPKWEDLMEELVK